MMVLCRTVLADMPASRFEMNDVVIEIADRNCVQRPSLEMFREAPEDRLILPVRVGLFQSLDVFQVLRDGGR